MDRKTLDFDSPYVPVFPCTRLTKPSSIFEEKPVIRGLCPLTLLLAACAVPAAPAPQPRWERVDPDRDCKIVMKDNTVTMELPGGDHDLAPKRNRFNAPRLLREMEGDFIMQVRVCASFCPSAKSDVQREDPRVAAGLLLIPADENCIRLEYGAYRRKGDLSSGPAFRMRGEQIWNMYVDGWKLPWKQQIRKGNEEHIYLRLDRRGNSIYRFLSPDSEKWYAGSDMREEGSISVEFSSLPTKLKVGLAAYSTSTEPFKVRFDQFKLSRGGKKSK